MSYPAFDTDPKMKHTNYKYTEMKVMINIKIFPVNIFLYKNTNKSNTECSSIRPTYIFSA